MKKLKRIINNEKRIYLGNNWLKRIYNKLVNHIDYKIYKSVKYARIYRYYKNNKGIINKILQIYYGRKFYKQASLTNIEIYSSIGENLHIYHSNVVINENAVIGNNVIFHGNNCIGNNGKNMKAPNIGNNVDVGFGATVIGDITIADSIIIGANSVVTKSFLEPNIVIAGSPARKIKNRLGETNED